MSETTGVRTPTAEELASYEEMLATVVEPVERALNTWLADFASHEPTMIVRLTLAANLLSARVIDAIRVLKGGGTDQARVDAVAFSAIKDTLVERLCIQAEQRAALEAEEAEQQRLADLTAVDAVVERVEAASKPKRTRKATLANPKGKKSRAVAAN